MEVGTHTQATDISIQLDEVETRLGSLYLIRILLRLIPPRKDLFLSEVRIVIERQLRIHSQHLMVTRLAQRIDLDLRCVPLHKHLIKLLDCALRILNALFREPQICSNISGNIIRDTLMYIDVCGSNCVWRFLCHGLDIHAAL